MVECVYFKDIDVLVVSELRDRAIPFVWFYPQALSQECTQRQKLVTDMALEEKSGLKLDLFSASCIAFPSSESVQIKASAQCLVIVSHEYLYLLRVDEDKAIVDFKGKMYHKIAYLDISIVDAHVYILFQTGLQLWIG